MAEEHPLKTKPRDARQHVTAGPYSPVLEVDARRLVVISGQVAIDMDGAVVGDTIEEQTRATLDNCAYQLASAACTLASAFRPVLNRAAATPLSSRCSTPRSTPRPG